MGYKCLFQFWFPQGIFLGVGLLGHMVVLFLVFKGISILSSLGAVSITFPPTVQEHSLFATPSPAFFVCRLFDEGHSDLCEVTSHCSFDLHFSNNERCWASFYVFVGHYRYLLWRNVCLGLLPIYLFMRYMSCLYILGINPFSVASFVNILSVCRLSFHLDYSFLCYANVFKFN